MTFGTAILSLLGIIFLVGVFYVATTGKLSNLWQREGDQEQRGVAPDWKWRNTTFYQVILHNDDHTPMERVVRTLRKVVPQTNLKQAISVMLEAHSKGKAVVTRCPKEQAELYKEGLRAKGLTVTIESEESGGG